MRGTIEDWQRVAADTALLEHAAADPGEVGTIAKLRKRYGPTDVAIALELVKARGKAAAKFGDRAAAMVADVPGIEQASGQAIARYKAGRIRAALGRGAAVADLCCGIGGDTAALCDAGLHVTAIDRDPVRVWMARHNSGGRAQAMCMEVADWPPPPEVGAGGLAIHLDPARRNEGTGRRVWKLDDLQPPPDVIARLIESAEEAGAAVKLGPGVDVDALDTLAPGSGVEFIAEGNRLVQAVLWTGKLRRAARSATLLLPTVSQGAPGPRREAGVENAGGANHRLAAGAIDFLCTERNSAVAHTLEGEPGRAPLGPTQRYLYAVHPAVERAELIHLLAQEHNAPLIHRKLGLLTRDTPTTSPWLTGFELLAELPWRPRKVRQWLSQHDGGIVEVKTRGKAADPDSVAKQLRGKGETPYTVFVLRFDVRVVALVCRRV